MSARRAFLKTAAGAAVAAKSAGNALARGLAIGQAQGAMGSGIGMAVPSGPDDWIGDDHPLYGHIRRALSAAHRANNNKRDLQWRAAAGLLDPSIEACTSVSPSHRMYMQRLKDRERETTIERLERQLEDARKMLRMVGS